MAKEYLSKHIFNLFLFFTIFLVTLESCGIDKEKGSLLPEYQISNACLDSITTTVLIHNNQTISDGYKNVVLELNKLDSDTLEFVFSFHESEECLRNYFIEMQNMRVIGYIGKDSLDILIVSNINDYYDLKILKRLISVQPGKKRFEDLFFSPISGFDFETMYEPLCWHFKYANDEISQISIRKD